MIDNAINKMGTDVFLLTKPTANSIQRACSQANRTCTPLADTPAPQLRNFCLIHQKKPRKDQ